MAKARAALAKYRAKRDFSITTEPRSGGASQAGALQFVVQKHWATRLHYDFRLELDGTMKSWAVPKGPSYDPHDKRMAVHVEDHPIAYNRFEGEIPKGQYGGGKVIIWDKGTWTPLEDAHQGYRKRQAEVRPPRIQAARRLGVDPHPQPATRSRTSGCSSRNRTSSCAGPTSSASSIPFPTASRPCRRNPAGP